MNSTGTIFFFDRITQPSHKAPAGKQDGQDQNPVYPV
jgi:hypothetical protein